MRGRWTTDGIYGAAGLLAGIAFGIYGGPPMLEMIGAMVGGGVAVGWVLHLAIATVFGVAYGELVQTARPPNALRPLLGVLYGIAWWVFGALIAMPLILGMPDLVLDVRAGAASFWGHVVYGAILQGVGQSVAELAGSAPGSKTRTSVA